MFLVLGEELARPIGKKLVSSATLEMHYASFFSAKALTLVHRLVHQYYTSYKNVVKLFVSDDIAALQKKEITKSKKSLFQRFSIQNSTFNIQHSTEGGQQLVVFPDVWTMKSFLGSQELPVGTVILNATSTQQQKDKARRGIKMGHISTLCCTYSQIFQDRKDLKHILLIDQHQRYYKNQQDPRYDAVEVVKQMAVLYGAELVLHGMNIFADVET